MITSFFRIWSKYILRSVGYGDKSTSSTKFSFLQNNAHLSRELLTQDNKTSTVHM
jgi:hypothetical protein